MATVAVLLGGVFGFLGFMVSWLALGTGLLAAFGVYFAVTAIVAGALLIFALSPSRTAEDNRQTA